MNKGEAMRYEDKDHKTGELLEESISSLSKLKKDEQLQLKDDGWGEVEIITTKIDQEPTTEDILYDVIDKSDSIRTIHEKIVSAVNSSISGE